MNKSLQLFDPDGNEAGWGQFHDTTYTMMPDGNLVELVRVVATVWRRDAWVPPGETAAAIKEMIT